MPAELFEGPNQVAGTQGIELCGECTVWLLSGGVIFLPDAGRFSWRSAVDRQLARLLGCGGGGARRSGEPMTLPLERVGWQGDPAAGEWPLEPGPVDRYALDIE